MKAENGKRVSSAVPFGYKKNPDDEDHWLIDEPAAEVVRKIYDLCLAGRGPAQIARQLEKEQIMTPTEYYHSIDRKTSNDLPVKPFLWADSTIDNILANRQYTGCAVNFITTTISYKVHKTVYNPAEEQQIIPNMQEPIISEDVWERVQVLRNNKRRPTATGRKSLFSGLVYCPDCGAKMYFCASKSLRKDQEFFRCANYKDGRGTCKIHFIRDVVLERIVTEAVSDISDFIRCYENDFLNLIKMRNTVGRESDIQSLKSTILNGNKRIKEIDRNISSLFEKNVSGMISDERFMTIQNKTIFRFEQRGIQVLGALNTDFLANREQNLDAGMGLSTGQYAADTIQNSRSAGKVIRSQNGRAIGNQAAIFNLGFNPQTVLHTVQMGGKENAAFHGTFQVSTYVTGFAFYLSGSAIFPYGKAQVGQLFGNGIHYQTFVAGRAIQLSQFYKFPYHRCVFHYNTSSILDID